MSMVDSEWLLYADDLKLFLPIREASDVISLQSSVNCFSDWCMSIHRTFSPITHNYNISGSILQRCHPFRDLGVTLDCKLNFHQHYSDILDKANKMVRFIRRQSREFSDPHCLLMLYKSLVRPLFESSSVVWSPSSNLWSKKLESVQRCLLFGLETLEKRRDVAQQKFMSKLIIGETDAPELLARIKINVPFRIFRNFK